MSSSGGGGGGRVEGFDRQPIMSGVCSADGG